MSNPVTVQAVAGAIRATKGASRSHLYPSSSRGYRSIGVYTQKDARDRIVLDYWCGGYQHNRDRAEIELNLVTETLNAKGYKVTTITEKTYIGSQTIRVVEIESAAN